MHLLFKKVINSGASYNREIRVDSINSSLSEKPFEIVLNLKQRYTVNDLYVDNTYQICVKNPPTALCDYCIKVSVFPTKNAITTKILCQNSIKKNAS